MKIKRLDHVNFITHDPQATIDFYCDVIGLNLGNQLPIDSMRTLYFYIPEQSVAILHIGNAKAEKNKPTFKRLANLDIDDKNAFSTGSFDHFCLAVDINDYDGFIQKLESNKLTYQTYCDEKRGVNQVWLLDPNGVRIELNFS